MEALNEARNKMFEAIDITNAVLKTGDTKAINAAFDVQHDAIKAYDAATHRRS
jgi:hypothetical protein